MNKYKIISIILVVCIVFVFSVLIYQEKNNKEIIEEKNQIIKNKEDKIDNLNNIKINENIIQNFKYLQNQNITDKIGDELYIQQNQYNNLKIKRNKIKTTIKTQEEIKNIILQNFDEKKYMHLIGTDSKYQTTNKENMIYIMNDIKNNINIEDLNYISNYFDCDDYTDLYASIISARYNIRLFKIHNYYANHSYLIFISSSNNIYKINSQASSIKKYEYMDSKYKKIRGYILI